MSTSKKKLSLTFHFLHMRWFNACFSYDQTIIAFEKISINRDTPALCSNGQNFPAKRLRKILAYQIRMRQFFKKSKPNLINITQEINANKSFIVFYSFIYNVARTSSSHLTLEAHVNIINSNRYFIVSVKLSLKVLLFS